MQAMDEPANLSIGGTQEAHEDAPNFSLKLLRDQIEYVDVNLEIFENQTLIINEINHKRQLKDKEEQGSTDKLVKRAKKRKNLANILKGLKSQPQAKEHKKRDETFIRINGFYHCPDCLYETNRQSNLKFHMAAVHLKLKPWECSDCCKSTRMKSYYLKYFMK